MGTRPYTQKNSSKDKNHDEIVEGLRGEGYSVAETHMVGGGFPDLVVGVSVPGGGTKTVLVEIKSRLKWNLSPKQKRFMELWPGDIEVVTSVEDALQKLSRYRDALK